MKKFSKVLLATTLATGTLLGTQAIAPVALRTLQQRLGMFTMVKRNMEVHFS
ncbi:hypothetical protein RM588_08325 [Staphylococcus chromogenes]|uniref:hypothetical protein n=1 Tax=Staphylococcus chromogenes TaxID=46126 RepID=UPI00288741ED|nr:hypothetical protein [Staphylococcus chromogenes]MDT0655825.1 hypothetical protein [Staphylococcus chromogenes]